MNRSLSMEIEQLASGEWVIDAPWLSAPIGGASFEEAYWAAIAAGGRHPRRA